MALPSQSASETSAEEPDRCESADASARFHLLGGAAPGGAAPPARPTLGPPQRSVVVPPTLLDELHALDAKIQRREAELEDERRRLDRDRERFERAVAAQEWTLQREQHELHAAQQTWEASQATSGAVASNQQARLTIVASGGEVTTTLATLTRREPASGLATAARKALAADADAGVGTGAEAQVVIDREAALTHRVVEWLRDGAKSLDGLPPPVLQRMQAEAAHWQMPSLGAELAEVRPRCVYALHALQTHVQARRPCQSGCRPPARALAHLDACPCPFAAIGQGGRGDGGLS